MSLRWVHPSVMPGRRVTLRALSPDDRDGLLAAFSDDLEDVFTTVVPNEASIDGWFATLETERLAERAFPYVVLDEAGKISGTTRLMRISPQHRRLEIGGTVYAKRVQRTGLNIEAKLLLLGHAFERLECNVVQLRTDWLNHQSRMAIERLGAKLDGVLRGHLVMPDGHIRDSVVYSIVASEWSGVRTMLRHRLDKYEKTGG